MPGREESFQDAVASIERLGISRIVSLADLNEIRFKAPDYVRAIEDGQFVSILATCPIPDRGVSQDPAAFVASVQETAAALKASEKVLVHCGAGIGRTGTYAAAVLVALGLSKDQALERVSRAGSRPETAQQIEQLDMPSLRSG
jgi:protein-tyrosine phosphatase